MPQYYVTRRKAKLVYYEDLIMVDAGSEAEAREKAVVAGSYELMNSYEPKSDMEHVSDSPVDMIEIIKIDRL